MVVVVVLILFAAAWYAASPVLASFHAADSLLPLWMGWTKWTPFYWGQNRFGMPLAALATLFRSSPWVSYIAYQGALYALSLISVFVLSYSLRRNVTTGLISCTAVPLLMTPRWWMEFANQPYGSSMGFFALASLPFVISGNSRKLGKHHLGAAVVLVAIAFWINQSLALWVAGSFLGQMAWGLERPRYWAWIALCVFGFLAAAYLQTLPGLIGPNYAAVILPRDFLRNIAQCIQVVWKAAPAFCLLLGGTLLAAAFARAMKRPIFQMGEIWVLRTTACVFLLTSVMWWTRVNDNNIRYFLPCISVAITVCSACVASLLPKPSIRWMALSFLLLATLVQTGLPGKETTIAALERTLPGEVRPDLTRCGILTGDYWKVWNILIVKALRQDSLIGLPQGMTTRAGPIKDVLNRRIRTEKVCFMGPLEKAQENAAEFGIQVPSASWVAL